MIGVAHTILSVAFPLLPVGPGSGGGAEQVLYLLEKGVVESGDRSIVIAARGSEVTGELVETPAATSEITETARADAQRIHRLKIEEILASTKVDLIHFHGLDFYAYAPGAKPAMLATLHLPLNLYPASVLTGNVQLNCVSRSQAKTNPAASSLPVVENGVDIAQYKLGSGPRSYLLTLGRICSEKGVAIALRVARKLDLTMIVAGPVHPFRDHQIYFNEKVKPLLDNERHYIGPVDLEKKTQLLSEARCLLIPSLIAETSSLVAMEAIASGTPVVAFRSGALPEIVEHGKTGFIVDSEDEMAIAVSNVSSISPDICKARALERFDRKRMTREYLYLYRRIIDKFKAA